MEEDPLAIPKRRSATLTTKAARKQPAEPAEYEVEKIVGHKQEGRQISYRIRWKGWGPKDDTWEPEEDLNCDEMLEKYKKFAVSVMLGTTPSSVSLSSPKKRGRPAGSKGSPKKNVVTSGKVAKKRGRPSLKAGTKSPKKATTGKKRGRKPRSDKEWEVEEIVAVRTTEAGTEEFLVKWRGYSSEDNTWEPADNVANCHEEIARFRETNGDAEPSATNGEANVDNTDDPTTTEDEEEAVIEEKEHSLDD